MIGVISLAGIVVNNAIVLIDCINQQKRDGQASIESILMAGRLRLRPVLLTASTTILGLIPMAVAVIFGLAVSTLLTLEHFQ